MVKLSMKKKIVATSATLGLGFAVAIGAAYAYWATSAQGSVTTGDSAIELKQIGQPTVLAPGAKSLVRVNIRNVSSGPLLFGTLKVAVQPGFSSQTNPALPACTNADFDDAMYAVNDTYAAGGGLIVEAGLVMKNLATDQSNCKGLTIPLALSMS
jgi:hypothetical protein